MERYLFTESFGNSKQSGVSFKSFLLEALKFPFLYCLVIFSDTFFFLLGFAIRNKTAFTGACERSFAKLFLLFIKNVFTAVLWLCCRELTGGVLAHC